MKSTLVTVSMLSSSLDLFVPRIEAERVLAVQLLAKMDGEIIERSELDGYPVFHVQERAVLYFQAPGKQGSIRGAVLVDGDRIQRFVLLRSREGLSHNELYSPEFLAFQGQPTDHRWT